MEHLEKQLYNAYEGAAISMPALPKVFTKLILILLETKVIGLGHQYRARSACTSVQSDQALYCWLEIPKNKNGQFQIWKMNYSI